MDKRPTLTPLTDHPSVTPFLFPPHTTESTYRTTHSRHPRETCPFVFATIPGRDMRDKLRVGGREGKEARREWSMRRLQQQGQARESEETIGSFKVGNYLPLKFLLIYYLFVFYCQIGNKWM